MSTPFTPATASEPLTFQACMGDLRPAFEMLAQSGSLDRAVEALVSLPEDGATRETARAVGQRTAQWFRAWHAALGQTEREVRTDFLAARRGELTAEEPGEVEWQDLDRRLLAAVQGVTEGGIDLGRWVLAQAAAVDARAEHDPVLRAAVDALWQDVERQVEPRLLATAVEVTAPFVGFMDALRGGVPRTLRQACTAPAPLIQHGPLYRICLAWHWSAVLWHWRVEQAVPLAVRAVLAGDEEAVARSTQAPTELRAALEPVLSRAAERLGWPVPLDALPALGEQDGMFALDTRAAGFLAGLTEGGSEGAAAAEEMRLAARQRWEEGRAQPSLSLPHETPGPPWRPWENPARFPRLLARVLWRGRVKPMLLRDQGNAPALAFGELEVLGETYWAGRGRRVVERGASGAAVVDLEGKELATVPAELVDDLGRMQQQFAALRTWTGHQVLRHQILTGHRQAIDPANPDPRHILIEGGIAGYAEALGIRSNNTLTVIHDVLEAERRFHLRWARGTVAGLITYTLKKGGPHTPSELSIILGDVLLPHYVTRLLPKTGERQRQLDRRLVPVVALPPRVGRARDHGAQAAFQMYLLAEFRERAPELLAHGGIQLAEDTLRRLAERSGLPIATLPTLLDRWTCDGDDGPAFLRRVDGDHFTLAEGYASALDFLKYGAELSADGKTRRSRGRALRRRAR
jgi:hypothetical protein